jgi:hypothetical protein
MKKLFALFLVLCLGVTAQGASFSISRLKYAGGGDWYNDPDEETNLEKDLVTRAKINARTDREVVSLQDDDLFSHPFLYITGHGNISFSENEVTRLRKFLTKGGFLYADDDYGMDDSFKREMEKVFPEKAWVELPFDHPIYHCFYDFPNGLPKTHEHYPGAPHGYALFHEGRMIAFYTYNSNITDGWTAVHDDPPEKREEALKMGVNIVWYVLTH